VYFPSKNALYDALFARGAQMLLDHVRADAESLTVDGRPLEELLRGLAETFVNWSLEHPAYTQLLFWRPVPGFTPSPEAYAPAIEMVELTRERFTFLQQQGLVRADVDIDDAQRDWTVLISGVISQQLSNQPGESFATGRFTAGLPGLVAMFAQYYGTTTGNTHTRSSARSKRETRNVRKR
jgi:AcrR family transcriptional regulator